MKTKENAAGAAATAPSQKKSLDRIEHTISHYATNYEFSALEISERRDGTPVLRLFVFRKEAGL